MTDARELDIVVLEDDQAAVPLPRDVSTRSPTSPSLSGSNRSGREVINGSETLPDVSRHVSLDEESQESYGELDLIKERAQAHRKGHRKTFGRVHLVEQADAIDEVERALELEEVRDSVLGLPHSRSASISHVHFQLTGSQEERVREKEELEEVKPEEKDPNQKPDIFGAIFNLMNYALGAGILALPYAFRQAGLLVGAAMVIVVGAATVFSMMLLLGASKASQTLGYEQLARVTYGDKFAQFVKVTIIVDSFGALSAYMILIADTTTELAKSYLGTTTIWSNKILVLSLVTIFIMFPLCCLKNINYLGFTSALSLIPQIYFLVLLVVYMVQAGGIQTGLKLFNSGVFYALPIVIFSFSSQQALFPLYTELQERNGTEKDIKNVAMVSIGLTALCYLFSGTMGVFTYPTNAKGMEYQGIGPTRCSQLARIALFLFDRTLTHHTLLLPHSLVQVMCSRTSLRALRSMYSSSRPRYRPSSLSPSSYGLLAYLRIVSSSSIVLLPIYASSWRLRPSWCSHSLSPLPSPLSRLYSVCSGH